MQQETQAIKEELNQPKAFHTKREDYEKSSYSRSCPGCRALLTGTTRQKRAAVQAEDGEGDGRIGEGEECKATKRGVPRGHRLCGRRGREQRHEHIKEL